MGPHVEAVIAQCRTQKREVPESIQKRLEMIEPWMDFYMIAFADLDTCRDQNERIPWSAIDAYAYRYGLLGIDFDWLVRVIRSIETYFAERRPKAEEKDDRFRAPSKPARKAS